MADGNHAIIVGGAGGIGSAIARRLARDGYTVTLADIDQEAARKLALELEGEGHEAVGIDVASEASVDGTLDAIEARAPARVLVIASGGMVTRPGSTTVATMSTADWNRGIALNLSGTFFCMRRFAAQRLANPLENARIIVIASGAGQRPDHGLEVVYSAAKAAVMGLVRQVAFDFGPASITVNAVAPGPIATEVLLTHTPEPVKQMLIAPAVLKRLGTPEEAAAGVAFLASPEASYITGTTLDINGGIHMH